MAIKQSQSPEAVELKRFTALSGKPTSVCRACCGFSITKWNFQSSFRLSKFTRLSICSVKVVEIHFQPRGKNSKAAKAEREKNRQKLSRRWVIEQWRHGISLGKLGKLAGNCHGVVDRRNWNKTENWFDAHYAWFTRRCLFEMCRGLVS